MAKLIDENIRAIEDRLKVKEESKTEEKKDEKEDKKGTGIILESYNFSILFVDKQAKAKNVPTETVPVHAADQRQICKKNHRQKCAFATILGMRRKRMVKQ
jgi:hypothetical protein